MGYRHLHIFERSHMAVYQTLHWLTRQIAASGGVIMPQSRVNTDLVAMRKHTMPYRRIRVQSHVAPHHDHRDAIRRRSPPTAARTIFWWSINPYTTNGSAYTTYICALESRYDGVRLRRKSCLYDHICGTILALVCDNSDGRSDGTGYA